ncbi:MAG TPA: glycine zipper domain-containing protein [Woeseiaceae bacterium]|nr:glycine zipper domain-containing protein [Woeseiaceae bacterium]
MKNLLATAALIAVSTLAPAQEQKSLSATLEVYAFPSDGQDAAQQSKDESECYQWAVGNAGVDPFDLAKQEEASEAESAAKMAEAQQAGKGAGARGAVGGAAAGALIGEIASDDASEGAAWGAAAGLVHGRRSARRASQEAQAEVASEAVAHAQVTAAQMDNFKKAFSVCLEAKNYLVKY